MSNAPQPSRVGLAEIGRLIGFAALALPMPALHLLGASDAAPAADVVVAVTLVLAAGFSLHAASRRTEPALVSMRRFLGGAMATAAVGVAVTPAITWGGLTSGWHWLADALNLSSLLFAGLGFSRVPQSDDSPRTRFRRRIDVVIAGSSLLFFGWLLVLKPLLHQQGLPLPDQLVSAAYVLADVAVAAVIVAVVRYARTELQSLLLRSAVGTVLIAVAQAAATRQTLEQLRPTFGVPTILLEAGVILVAYSAFAATTIRRDCPAGPTWRFDAPMITAALTVALGFPYVAAGHLLGVSDVAPAAVMIMALLTRQRLYAGDLREVAAANEQAAKYDDLTGLANRRVFLGRLAEHLATPGAGPLAVALMDLDGFKEINDRFGHLAGDEILVTFSQALHFGDESLLAARLGGDEFAVACFSPDAVGDVRRIAEDLAKVHRISTEAHGVLAISCSAGIAVSLEEDRRASDVMRRADLAMYAAKTHPAAAVVTFAAELQAAASRRHLLIAALSGAAERGEFHLVFQPLYDLVSGDLVAAEALLRWTHPTLGSVPPDEFIPLAEETGQINAIGDWVLDTAAAEVAAWEHRGRYLPRLLVNVSTQQFDDPNFVERVEEVLAEHGLAPDRVTLEMTESQLAGMSVTDDLNRLHAVGINTAIDDFGAGHSSLARLSRLSSHLLKIDREFIVGIDEPACRVVLEAVTALAQTLDMATVAEGIETEAQRDVARKCGITWGQGYLFARPLPPDVLEPLLPRLPPALGHRPDRQPPVAAGRG